MLASLLLLQLGLPADTLSAITVRDADQRARVPVERIENVAMVSVDRLAASFRERSLVRRITPDRFAVTLAGAQLELSPGSAVVRKGTTVAPLPSPARLKGSELFVPIAFVSEVLPRLAPPPGVAYDASRAELRRVASTPATATAARATPAPVRRTPPKAKAKAVVVIDPGHGGPDRGMSGPMRGRWKIHEADLTLQIGRKVRDALKQNGVEVIMTRSKDTLIALADRGRIANENNASLFLSVHINAANRRWRNPAGARGFETYFLSEARTDDARRVEEMENSSIQYEVDALPAGDDALSFILKDMKQNESLRESQLLAEAVQNALGKIHPGPSRGVKQAGFRVLVAALVPAVLVEVGFGTNAAEARYLASDKGQRALASAIAKSTLGYLAAYERRRTAGDTAR